MKKIPMKTDKDGVLLEPINVQGMKGRIISANFGIDFNDLLGIGIEGLNDIADEKVVANGVLTDIVYNAVAVRDGQIVIQVSGVVDEY